IKVSSILLYISSGITVYPSIFLSIFCASLEPKLYGVIVSKIFICQEVCPHNVEIPTTHILEFKENIIDYLDYDEIQNISNKEFK
ncbi:hypothetical protein ACTPEF_26605, partial [Clostridioides difficile]